MKKPLSADQFWGELQHVVDEVETAVSIYQTYEEINRQGQENLDVFAAFNRDASFWNLVQYSLQTSLFIVLARIFDTASDAHSIYALISTSLAQPDLFSRAVALRERRRGKGTEPEWLDEFIQSVWVPNGAGDLRHLKKELAKNSKTFESIYRRIRHEWVAHRIVTKDQAYRLFERTNRVEIGEILDFLHDLVDTIRELFQNGRKPELGTRAEYYAEYNRNVRDSLKALLLQ